MATATIAKQGIQNQGATRPPTNEEDERLTVSEAARRIGCHRNTIAAWIKDGLLAYERDPSGMPRVRTSTVNAILKAADGKLAGVEV